MRNLTIPFLATLLAACGSLAAPTASATGTPAGTARSAGERARQALVDQLNLSVEAVTIVSSEPVDWPDAALGCPESGMAYAQVITPGFRVTLTASGKTYFVHTDLETRAVVCAEPVDQVYPEFPVTPGSIDDGQPWMPVY